MYSSDRKFRIWFYSVSHSILILRSEKQYPDVEYDKTYSPNNTIDIEFSGVEFISIPASFETFRIKRFRNKYEFNDNPDFYVRAYSCIIGTSDWDSDEGKFSDLTLEYESTLRLD